MNNSRRSALVWLLVSIVLLLIAFSIGMTVEKPEASTTSANSSSASLTTGAATSGDYYSNPAQWQAYSNASAGFSIAHPTDFSTDESNSPAPSTDWRMNNVDQAPGIKSFTLTVPTSFEPQTNFVGATLTVGYSRNDKALADCLVARNGDATSNTQTIGNATFTIFTLNDAGAGQLYKTTSYRTTHAGACYAVEYTIHSAQLGNYPSSYGLQQFDEGKIDTLLRTIVSTFQFL